MKALAPIVILLMLCSCARADAPLVGKWRAGACELEFSEDRKLYVTLFGKSSENADKYVTLEYKISDDGSLKITAKALSGILSEHIEIPYEIKGNSLLISGAKFTKIK